MVVVLSIKPSSYIYRVHSLINKYDSSYKTCVLLDLQLKESQKVVMFKFQFWDCGDHSLNKYDHLLPVSVMLSSFVTLKRLN